MPPISYSIDGTIRINSLIKGSAEVEHTIDTDKNGIQGLDLYVGGGTTTTKTTVYIKNLTTKEEVTISTGSDGIFVYDLANLSEGYSDGDIILIRVSTYLTNDTEEKGEVFVRKNQEWNEQAECPKRLLVDSYGNEFNQQNPLPTKPITEDFSGLNYSQVWTRDSKGRTLTETRTYKGTSIRRTWSYTGSNFNADSISAWSEV